MTPLLDQFLSEARDFLQAISEKLMQLEEAPGDAVLMVELFRMVHTLKGNCGLFDLPEMSRVLHAGEDLMVVVRDGNLPYSQLLADRLLDAMDFVGMLLDEIETSGSNTAAHAEDSVKLAQSLRELIGTPDAAQETTIAPAADAAASTPGVCAANLLPLAAVPEALRMQWYRQLPGNAPLLWLSYTPEADCFFKGEDPFYQVRQTPQIAWQRAGATAAWPTLTELDAYRCTLSFELISTAPRAAIEEHFRYVPEQITITEIPPMLLALPVGDENGGPVYEDFVVSALAHLDRGDRVNLERATHSMLELSSASLWLASALRWLLLVIEREPGNPDRWRALIESLRTFTAPIWHPRVESSAAPVAQPGTTPAVEAILAIQMTVLGLPDQVNWLAGRLKSVASTLTGCFRSMGQEDVLAALGVALDASLAQSSSAPLRGWLAQNMPMPAGAQAQPAPFPALKPVVAAPMPMPTAPESPDLEEPATAAAAAMAAPEQEVKLGRRAEDVAAGPKMLKVDQEKIDRLMNLIGEIVVAKNGLPYLATKAETVFGVRELSREIKTQYAVINRITEEMQDAIMQVRMLPVSFVFQRFPRLVRDISRKLGKEVNLVLEGEDTEADKNIIEALADPLIHIVRNSLDHGLELPEVRRAAGKPAAGQLRIRASQEGGRAIIDISDDGKGIDPALIKRKAHEKGIIDEATLESISDQDAINLVFAAGFSTVDVVSDLSGRGVGMDVVRAAVERVNGTLSLESKTGQGTRIRLSLPLSMAVTNVMIIESNQQIFGVPMDLVVETMRIPRASIHTIKNHQTAVLRGRIVPLRSLNELLATDQAQIANGQDELATLVIRLHGEHVGIVVDDFREVVDIILKPMSGILGGLPGYTGSALLGDGSVLMVLNPKELV